MVCIEKIRRNMMNLLKKKQAAIPAYPVDKNRAIPGFTKVIKQFADAQIKMEPDFIPIFLYVKNKKDGMSLCFLTTTFFARINNHHKNPEHGVSLFLNRTILEDLYESFEKTHVATAFTKERGVVDTPGNPGEKCEFYIKDFGYDAEEASAIMAMLLDEAFKINPEDITLQIQLFGCNDEGEGEESNAEYDCEGNKIAQSGFSHDLF